MLLTGYSTHFTGIIGSILMLASIQESFASTDTLLLTFAIAKTELTTEHKEKLIKAFTKVMNADSIDAEIIGSADYLGDNSRNQRISDLRTQRVLEYLSVLAQNKKISFSVLSRGEINSHLELTYGPGGVVRDRSVQVIFQSIYQSTQLTEYRIEDLNLLKQGQSLIVENLNFYPSRHVLLPRSVPQLKKLLVQLLKHPNTHFEIQGHICCISKQPSEQDGWDMDSKNDQLSHNRALNIYNFLVRNGVDSTKLTYKGYAFQRPLIFPEITDLDKMKNRRVEIKVVNKN